MVLGDNVKFRFFLETLPRSAAIDTVKLPPPKSPVGFLPDLVRPADVIALSLKLEKIQQDTSYRESSLSVSFDKKLPDKIKLLQFDGNICYIPENRETEEYFSSTTAKERLLVSKTHMAQQFREQKKDLLSRREISDFENITSDIKGVTHVTNNVTPAEVKFYKKQAETIIDDENSSLEQDNRDKALVQEAKAKAAKRRRQKERADGHRSFALTQRSAIVTAAKRLESTSRKNAVTAALKLRQKAVAEARSTQKLKNLMALDKSLYHQPRSLNDSLDYFNLSSTIFDGGINIVKPLTPGRPLDGKPDLGDRRERSRATRWINHDKIKNLNFEEEDRVFKNIDQIS